MSTPLVDEAPGDADAPATPDRSIVCCAVPGADEHVVGRALRAAGVGEVRAWFDVDAVARRLLAEWRVELLDEYVTALHGRQMGRAGVFGLVLHWHQLRRLHRQVDPMAQPTPHRLLALVERLAPAPTFVRVRRADRGAHATALAATTYGAVAAGTPERLLDAVDAVWGQWFTDAGIVPVEVHADVPAEVAALPARLGLAGR